MLLGNGELSSFIITELRVRELLRLPLPPRDPASTRSQVSLVRVTLSAYLLALMETT